MADSTTTFAAKDESFAKTVDQLSNRLKGFQGETETFTARAGNLGKSIAAMVGPLAAMSAAFLGARGAVSAFKEAIDAAGQLNDLSARTGETAGRLAVLQRAFENAGIGADSVGPALNRLQRALVEAGEGGATYQDTLAKLNLSHEELLKLNPTEQLQAVAQALSGLGNPAERSAAAMQLLGRGGGELLPLLRAMGPELATARAQLGSYPDVIDASNQALDALGDNLGAVTRKAREFATGALAGIAPQLAAISESIATVDFAKFGLALGEALRDAYDTFRGLWQDPRAIFGIFTAYLDATWRNAGDSLATALVNGARVMVTFLEHWLARDPFKILGGMLADAMIASLARWYLFFLDRLEGAAKFFAVLWDDVTTRGVTAFAEKLSNVIKFFASDFVTAINNPVAFVAGKLRVALSEGVIESGKTFEFAWGKAAGDLINKTRAGLEAVAKESGQNLELGAQAFGDTLKSAIDYTVANTELVRLDLFGGAEATQLVMDRIAAAQQSGAQIRMDLEAAANDAARVSAEMQAAQAASAKLRADMDAAGFAAEGFKPAFLQVEESGNAWEGALNRTFPMWGEIQTVLHSMVESGQLFETSMSNARVQAEATGNITSTFSERTKEAAERLNHTLDVMRDTFHFGQQSTRENVEMTRAENRLRNAENQRDRDFARADRMEVMGQERSAHDLRMRAEERFTRAVEFAGKDMQKRLSESADDWRKKFSASVHSVGGRLIEAASTASNATTTGANTAAQALIDGANAAKEALVPKDKNLATEQTLLRVETLLDRLEKKLPQNALS